MKKLYNWSNYVLNRINVIIDSIDNLKDKYRNFSDDDFKKYSEYLLKRLSLGETVNDIIAEALAFIREAAFRVHGLFAYRVQLMGAIVIHEGNFAEMKTGEGKTLTISLAAYIMALQKKGVHIVTVNEYLVKRDAEFCRKIFNFVGMTVGFNTNSMSKQLKQQMFLCDVIYTQNSELVFDYLRDNLSLDKNNIIIPRLAYAIIDEGDSILIDEASTPLIISKPQKENIEEYVIANKIVSFLEKGDFKIDWEAQTVILSSIGISKIESLLKIDNLYIFEFSELIHKINNALIANFIFKNGKEYIVKDNKIQIIDQFTGRLLKDRNYNNGLHQAIQVKEYLTIQPDNKIASKITYQAFFRKYLQISAISGTGISEYKELQEIYNMIVVSIPTHRKILRVDLPDIIFGNRIAKIKHIINEIKIHYLIGQPILVGTSSVNESEEIYNLLQLDGIKSEILNARNHKREAEIISYAGKKYSITIATNIAGRGVDIKLDQESKDLGGLYVIGCERNESKRVDDQLRGRSGRQGDPGKSIFFVSLEDAIFKRFGTNKFYKVSQKINDEYFDSKFFSKTITNIQYKIQNSSFDSRKYLIEYNELLFRQQNIVYKHRMHILKSASNKKSILSIIDAFIPELIEGFMMKKRWFLNKNALVDYLNKYMFFSDIFDSNSFSHLSIGMIKSHLRDIFILAFNIKISKIDDNHLEEWIKQVIMRKIDDGWQIHLEMSEKIRYGIGLRSMEQKSPLNIYVEQLGILFKNFKQNTKECILREIFNIFGPINRLELNI